MTMPTTADARSSRDLDLARSRKRAVNRVFTGYVVTCVGWLGNVASTPILEGLLGVSQFPERVWAIGARSLFWLGILIAASGGTHLLRFGGRRGVIAFTSFAAAGACGLVALAEQFETWFLDTRVLSRLDEPAAYTALILVVVGGLLLRSTAGEVTGKNKGDEWSARADR